MAAHPWLARFIQTLTMVDSRDWLDRVHAAGDARERGLVVQAYGARTENLFPWLIRGADFDNDSGVYERCRRALVCRAQKIEVVTRSRAYKKK